jgi:hypothetical protein
MKVRVPGVKPHRWVGYVEVPLDGPALRLSKDRSFDQFPMLVDVVSLDVRHRATPLYQRTLLLVQVLVENGSGQELNKGQVRQHIHVTRAL